MQTVYWLILFVILLIIEILTMGLTTIWFAGGALVAFVSGVIGFGLSHSFCYITGAYKTTCREVL